MTYMFVATASFLLLGCGATEMQNQTTQRSLTSKEDSSIAIEQNYEDADNKKSQTQKKSTKKDTKNISAIRKKIDINKDKDKDKDNKISDADKDIVEKIDELEVEDNTPKVISSEGTGGPTGMNEVTFTSSNNLTSTYKINAPEDSAQKVYGLHVHLHGDGGGGYTDFPNIETRHGLIGVTVRSPNQGTSWNRDGENFSLFLNELIQDDLLKKYDIDINQIFFSSVSGGSYFMTGSFLPLFAQQYNTGGAFMMCGGRAPQVSFAEPAGEGALKEFRLHWESTNEIDRADIRSSVEQSIAAYKTLLDNNQGNAASQTNQIQDDFGHCEFDGQNYTSGIQLAIDTRFKNILPAEIATSE